MAIANFTQFKGKRGDVTAAEEAELTGLVKTAIKDLKKERDEHAKERKAWALEMKEHKEDHDAIKLELKWLRGAVEPMKKERDRFTWLGRLGITIFGAATAIGAFWYLCIQIISSFRGE